MDNIALYSLFAFVLNRFAHPLLAPFGLLCMRKDDLARAYALIINAFSAMVAGACMLTEQIIIVTTDRSGIEFACSFANLAVAFDGSVVPIIYISFASSLILLVTLPQLIVGIRLMRRAKREDKLRTFRTPGSIHSILESGQ